MIKLDLTEDMVIKMMMPITTMNRILKIAATHREEVTQHNEECLLMAVVTMAMTIDREMINYRMRVL